MCYILQLWSGKWCIKDEHKLLSDLGTNTNGIGGGGGGGNYYEPHHNGFSTSSGGIGPTESILYDSITTKNELLSPPQSTLYTPPVVTSIGKQCFY